MVTNCISSSDGGDICGDCNMHTTIFFCVKEFQSEIDQIISVMTALTHIGVNIFSSAKIEISIHYHTL